MKCPICKQTVTPAHFACHSGAKGGAAGTGDAKRRKVSSEQARKAVQARWAKRKEKENEA